MDSGVGRHRSEGATRLTQGGEVAHQFGRIIRVCPLQQGLELIERSSQMLQSIENWSAIGEQDVGPDLRWTRR